MPRFTRRNFLTGLVAAAGVYLTAVVTHSKPFKIASGIASIGSSGIEEELEAEYNLRLYGDTSAVSVTNLSLLLNHLSQNWDNFYRHMEFVQRIDLSSAYLPEGGVCAADTKRRLMIVDPNFIDNSVDGSKEMSFNSSYIVHELAHFWTEYYPMHEGYPTHEELWNSINPSDYYFRLEENEREKSAKIYSDYNFKEDIAVLAQSVYLAKFGIGSTVWGYLNNICGIDGISKKLNLLGELGYISSNERDIAIANLNYNVTSSSLFSQPAKIYS